MNYIFPSTIEEAINCREETPSGKFIAGGTDLMVAISRGDISPETLIDLSRIPELGGILEEEKGLVIGPACTLSALASDARLPSALIIGASSIGSLQIRNLATVGGNICNASPCGDTLPPLIVLGAVLVLVSKTGRREVEVEDFFMGPKKTVLQEGELLSGIKIPRKSLSGGSSFRKIGQRNGQIISQVNVAVWLKSGRNRQVEEIRAAAGSVGPVPIRLVGTEAALKGSKLSEEIIKEAVERAINEISPISDVRATDEYRKEVIGPLLEDCLEDALDEALDYNTGMRE